MLLEPSGRVQQALDVPDVSREADDVGLGGYEAADDIVDRCVRTELQDLDIAEGVAVPLDETCLQIQQCYKISKLFTRELVLAASPEPRTARTAFQGPGGQLLHNLRSRLPRGSLSNSGRTPASPPPTAPG